ncbi:hypothetical protein HMPREF9318_02038 [Streptococcus urinalis FB127-CNA-2]|uniref:Iron chelate uptake ABC transporter, FeCT family, permease protein n=1 Tax=Streptococcus urinalis 2285-97 TaxID=764291 RepID=G5KCJ9_9STRE|nr:iron ABC transporter permease [Streptococcus urinalis]EHJ57739.1 iron chelate uptake ABC transporter, FeCT family, permease protein [Streptococcus urinalis 2285-97]EKS17161.1 hypothetical protein HMPREF9318_02038 [Streptococcus urinalis FB127-CNA-2]VEF32589.1 iron complex transport system permease [Streptococcus urinalis]
MTSQHFKKIKTKQIIFSYFVVASLFLLGFYCALRFGAINLSNHDLANTLKQPFQQTKLQDIIIDIRLPRLIAAILVGAALSVAGALIQGVTRNPIADPGLLGINAGAGLALVIAYAFFHHLHYSMILLVSMFGASLTAILIFIIAYQPKHGYNQMRLILTGAMISTLFLAIGQGITIYFTLSRDVIGWQAGGLVSVNWEMLAIISPFILISLIIAQLLAHQLTILSLNETISRSLGQNTLVVTISLLVIVLLLSSAAVAIIGSISFVGLIIPHIAKLCLPKNYRYIIPFSAFLGATFLLWVDLVCRTLNPPYETPINALVSIVGLPFFLWLVQKGDNK